MNKLVCKKIKDITAVIFLTLIYLGILSFTQNNVYAQQNSSGDKKLYNYEQSRLNRVIKKDLKIKIAVFVSDGGLKVKDSLFNPLDEDAKVQDNIKIDNSRVEIKLVDRVKERENKEKVKDAHLATGLLVDRLNRTGKFIIVERQDINAILREIDFEGSKWVKRDQANKMGDIYGIQYILIANLLRNKSGERISSNNYTITLRLCDVKTAVVSSSGTGDGKTLKETVDVAVTELVSNVNSLPWTCRIVKAEKEFLYLNAGKDEGLKERDILALYKIKEEIVDPVSKRVLGVNKQKVGKIEVVDVLGPDLSKAKILEASEPVDAGFIAQADPVTDVKGDEISKWKNIFGDSAIKDSDQKKDSSDKKYFDRSDMTLPIETIAESAGPAVVLIATIGNIQNNLGSGFIVTTDGLVVTNAHIIRGASAIGVKLANNNEMFTNVRVVKIDPFRDIALLKIENSVNLPIVMMGDSDQVIVGERVVAIGNPKGLENTVSDGLVSAIRDIGQGYKLIQISAPISQGSSGGALLNMRGEVIGITSSKAEGGENLNFAIPINYVKQEVERF